MMSGNKVSFNKEKNLIIKRLRTGQFTEIEEMLDTYDERFINEFFKTTGKDILEWAIIGCANVAPLNFLVKYKERLALSEILDDTILQSFFMSIAGQEYFGKCITSFKEIIMQKLILLSSIDTQRLSRYMTENYDKPFMTENMRSNFGVLFLQSNLKLRI